MCLRQSSGSGNSAANLIKYRIVLFIYFLIGLLQTIFAFLVFNRPVDHQYFLEIANRGISLTNLTNAPIFELKSQIAGFVFYWICLPSRILGGHELIHILWLRVLSLWGFLLAYRWVCRLAKVDVLSKINSQSLILYLGLCLLYPGQIAWTASLLRDGISCTALFASLSLFSCRRWALGLLCTLACLALRPEFALLIFPLLIPISFFGVLSRRRVRILVLIFICILLSVMMFSPRSIQSDFADAAFGVDGLAYPPISGISDVKGYLLVIAQAVMDPISLNGLATVGLFHIMEVLFFCLIVLGGIRSLQRSNIAIAKLLIINFVTMWLFAYFEIFVSGFSRHRLALMVILMAVISIDKLMITSGFNDNFSRE